MEKIQEFIDHIKITQNLSPKSVIAYSSDIKDYLLFLKNFNFPIDSADSLFDYVKSITDRGLKDTTIKRKIISIKRYYTFLRQKKFINADPFLNVKFSIKQERKLPKVLTISEVSTFLQLLRIDAEKEAPSISNFEAVRNLCLFDLIISTGIRIGEAVSIKISDIILENNTMLIHGKGRRQRLLYISCDDTMKNLKRWLDMRGNLPVKEEALFVNRFYKPLSLHGVEYIYKKYKNKSGINNKSTPHFLRHTFATNMLANGADLRSVQEILGHASVSTTQIYTEVTMERKKIVFEKYNYRNTL